MARFLKSRIKSKGAAPGSYIFIGNQKMDVCKIRLMKYNADQLTETEYTHVDHAIKEQDPQTINWLNIDGLHDVEQIKAVGSYFNISPLAMENILNTDQRSKFFEDDHSIMIVAKAVYYENNKVNVEQISFILGDHFLISFQEKVGDHFEPIRKRIRKNIGRIRRSGADYLLYTLLDSLVDNCLINIEAIGGNIEKLEPRLKEPGQHLSDEIYQHKTEISYLRKTIRPFKEVITRLLKTRPALIQQDIYIYYEELFDLTEQAQEATETYFNIISDQLNILNTNLSNKVNEVMKVLTIFAAIFIPLTFIAGIYGTNFDNLPELHLHYGYFYMLGFMATVTAIMLFYFRKKKWF